MHSHYTESDLSHVSEDLFSFKLLASILVQSDFLIKTASISILHDYVYAVVLDERFNEFDKCWTLKHSEKLNFVLRALFVLFIEICQINGLQCVFLPIEFVSDEIDTPRGALSKRSYILVLE